MTLLAQPAFADTGHAVGAVPACIASLSAAATAYRALLRVDKTIILKNRMREIC